MGPFCIDKKTKKAYTCIRKKIRRKFANEKRMV